MSKGGYICKTCGSWIPIEAHGTYCKERNTTPPEPSTTAEELAARAYAEDQVKDIEDRKDRMVWRGPITLAYLAGYKASENDMTPLDERCFRAGVKEGMRLTAEIVERKDRELSKQYQEILTLKALLHDEAKDYAETIMKLCEECGVESIQDIGPKITRLEKQLAEVRQINANQIERIVEMRNQRHEVEEKLAESERKAAGYKEALEYYADENNYDRWVQEDDKADGSPSCCSEIDDGRRAREALAPNHPEEAGIGEGEK